MISWNSEIMGKWKEGRTMSKKRHTKFSSHEPTAQYEYLEPDEIKKKTLFQDCN